MPDVICTKVYNTSLLKQKNTTLCVYQAQQAAEEKSWRKRLCVVLVNKPFAWTVKTGPATENENKKNPSSVVVKETRKRNGEQAEQGTSARIYEQLRHSKNTMKCSKNLTMPCPSADDATVVPRNLSPQPAQPLPPQQLVMAILAH